jgi:hypothetical protein
MQESGIPPIVVASLLLPLSLWESEEKYFLECFMQFRQKDDFFSHPARKDSQSVREKQFALNGNISLPG